ncbi:MAG: glycosyltransferase [Chloroflexi bacterium]|nr:glycosyltransferase [Chloroflexota bacterium]MCI0645867.1 glycosyltransferase [Chloroflexota bacterium]MCI0725722.1 glycosyltransferase [Chloroflexota bacterium]
MEFKAKPQSSLAESDGQAVANTAADMTAAICHYNPTRHPYLQRLASLCVAALQKVPDDHLTILVCDGSPEPDPTLAEMVTGDRVCYLHAGRQLSFGATYNLGVAAAQTDYVALIANDILISSLQLQRLAHELKGDVGCAMPYLIRSDYATQVARRARVPRRCYPASMTLNVNVFRRDVLQAAGQVPEELSGSFNDMVVFHRLQAQGYRIALVNVGEVDHLRAITRRIASNMAYEQDLAAAPALALDLFHGVQPGRQKNFWARLYANAAQYPLSRLLWRLVSAIPWQLNQQRGLGYAAAWLEPYLACDLSLYGRALTRRRPAWREKP